MDDPLYRKRPLRRHRVACAAMWLRTHREEADGIHLYRKLGALFGCSADEAHEARWRADELDVLWPPQRRWP
ncbi:hypothetical protein [Phyllobacterium sp. P5_D12]